MKRKINIGIVDDEIFGRDFVEAILHNQFPDLEVIFKAINLKDALEKLQRYQPDLLFLDIELGDGSAFELFDQIPNLKSQVIFITAYDHYAIKAIKNDAVDYILKPINEEEFTLATTKALERLHHNKEAANEIMLPTAHGLRKIKINDIIRCEADSNYTLIYLIDKTKIMVSKTLQEFEEQFSEHNFIRIHHKHLINLNHLTNYIKGKGGQVTMSDDSLIDVSIRRKIAFLETIKKINF